MTSMRATMAIQWLRRGRHAAMRVPQQQLSMPPRSVALRSGMAPSSLPRRAGHPLRGAYSFATTTTTTSGNSTNDQGPSIWELAEALRDVEHRATTGGDCSELLEAIHAVTGHIDPTTMATDAREAAALALVQSGALKSLVGLVRDERLADLHIPTFLALIRLSGEPLILHELLRLDAPSTLARYLAHADPRLHAAACVTLGNLALDPAALATNANMSNAAVLEPLVRLATTSRHGAIQRSAVTTLGAIAAGAPAARALLAQPEHLLALAGLLTSDHGDDLRGAAAFALGNVLTDHETSAQELIRDSGALSELILLVSPAYDDDVCSAAAWALHHGVYMNYENQSIVSDAGGLGMLFQHVFAENEDLQTNALLALESVVSGHDENLASCRQNVDAIALLETLRADYAYDLSANARRALTSVLDQINA